MSLDPGEHPNSPPIGLVIDRDPSVRALVREVFEQYSLVIFGAGSGHEAEERLRNEAVNIVVVDSHMPGSTHPDLMAHVTRLRPAPVVVALADSAADAAATNPDVFEFIVKPLDESRVRRLATRTVRQLELLTELRRLRKQLRSREGYDRIVGRTESMERVRHEVNRVGELDVPVWFAGDAGTGKKLCARTLHAASVRRDRPFIVVHCAGLDDEAWSRPGGDEAGIGALLEQACEGALYFDGITRLSPDNQERLVAAFEADADSHVRLLCGDSHVPSDALEQGLLAEELYRRWSPFSVALPPLRERGEDIPLLARHFVTTIGEINHLPPIAIEPDALSLLGTYEWPGNVQELRNAIEHAVILASGGRIAAADLPDRIRESEAMAVVRPGGGRSNERFRDAKRTVVEAFERAYLSELLERHQGNVTSASQQAGMLRSALQRLLRKYGFKSADFRKRRAARSVDPTKPSVG